jgi:hypothetical protein
VKRGARTFGRSRDPVTDEREATVSILERMAGALLGLLTLLILAVGGLVSFIPDAGRYIRVKRM